MAIFSGSAQVLEAMHRRIAEVYRAADAGGLGWALGDGGLPGAPDLRRRFQATEDQLARVLVNGTEADLEAAIAAHVEVWREIAERWRRHRQRKAAA